MRFAARTPEGRKAKRSCPVKKLVFDGIRLRRRYDGEQEVRLIEEFAEERLAQKFIELRQHGQRDRDQQEIDLLIVRDGTIHPIEIKKTTAPAKKDIRHFSVLDKLKVPQGPGCVLCLTDTPMPITESIWATPISEI